MLEKGNAPPKENNIMCNQWLCLSVKECKSSPDVAHYTPRCLSLFWFDFRGPFGGGELAALSGPDSVGTLSEMSPSNNAHSLNGSGRW